MSLNIRRLLVMGSLLLLTGCGTRGIPPEVTAMATREKSPVVCKPQRIILDAGHGGRDTGAASCRENYEEKSLTLSTALLVQDQLKKMGYQTSLTRNHDIYLPLSTRAEIANKHDADLFVSIHYNFSTSKEAHGIEVFYYKEEKAPSHPRIVKSKQLAQRVLNGVLTQTGANSRGVKQANFAVVRETKMPAILIEAGFLSNRQERDKIKDPCYLRLLAKGIAEGIDSYLNKN
ncbi:MAG: N-acetylmuramoyl-L-alanine amidase [Verrucomicrobia bacterium]|nr:N-acetylmuramoyl-L-alanine amidase [Verrucomicrobiota bacterium]MBS0645236.1 N-acetylmuramoyl-L-alanine amidase [Verrucomicrobiota bacterium]